MILDYFNLKQKLAQYHGHNFKYGFVLTADQEYTLTFWSKYGLFNPYFTGYADG